MDNRSLHPNLARLAAAYDEILRRYSVGDLDPASAHAEIVALQARDDEGVIWTIDPQSGDWKRRTHDGTWVVDNNPPTSGVATLTAHDLSRDPRLFNPDSRISFDSAEVTRQGLRGAVRGKVGTPEQAGPSSDGRAGLWLVGLAVAVVAGLTMWLLAPGEQAGQDPAVDPSPVETTSPTGDPGTTVPTFPGSGGTLPADGS